MREEGISLGSTFEVVHMDTTNMLNTGEIRRRKNARQMIQLNMLLLGPRGIGKSTFVKNLVGNITGPQAAAIEVDNTATKDICLTRAHLEPMLEFRSQQFRIKKADESSVVLHITTCDVLEQIDNSDTAKEIGAHIEAQFDGFLADEVKVKRAKEFSRGATDKRFHACLYFLDGNTNGLRRFEIELFREIHQLINIILVIGKADRFTPKQIDELKQNVNDDVRVNKIELFSFGDDYMDDIFISYGHSYIRDSVPFALICGDETEVQADGSVSTIRRYPWGKINICDPRNSHFIILKGILLESHLQELRDITYDVLYENFRTKRLLERQNSKLLVRTKSVARKAKVVRDDVELKEDLAPDSSNISSANLIVDLGGGLFSPEGKVFSRNIDEKNKIIEAYQRKIGDLEKLLGPRVDGSSPVIDTNLNQRSLNVGRVFDNCL